MSKIEKAKRLEGYTTTIHFLECHFCGEKLESNEGNEITSAMFLLGAVENGWKEVTSRAFQVVAAACPECAVSEKARRDRC